jgi:hypothetical protein
MGITPSRHGLTNALFDAILASQDGACAICETRDPGANNWSIDHDHSCCPGIHSCGECICGILCRRCNSAIGRLGDDPDIMRAAIAYVSSFNREAAA